MILAVLCSAMAPAYAGDSGVIKIYRQPGVQSLHENDEVTLPAGIQFADVGPIKNPDYKTDRMVRYETIKYAILPKGAQCVDVPARVADNFQHFAVGASQRRLLGSADISNQPCPGRVCPWTAGITLQATVISGFDE